MLIKNKWPSIFLTLISVFSFSFYKGQDPYIDSLNVVLSKNIADSSKIKILSELSEICDVKDIPIYSIQVTKMSEMKIKAVNLTKKEKSFYLFHLSKAYNNLGYFFSENNELKKATTYYLNALKIQESIKDSSGMAATLNNIGLTYITQNQPEQAIAYFEKSFLIRSLQNDKDGMGGSLLNIGAIYNRQGNVLKAIEYYNIGLETYEKANNKIGIATALNNLAFVYSNQNDDAKALEYYKKAFALQMQINDKPGIGNSLNNMALILQRRKDHVNALKYFNRCLKIREELDDKKGISLALNNIGSVYIDQKLYDEALNYCNRSLNICIEINYQKGMQVAVNSIGIIYNKKGDLQLAEKFGLKSLSLSKELELPESIKNASQLLYDIYKRKNNSTKALEMLQLNILMRDSLMNQETRKASVRSQLKYEFEKKAFADSVRVSEDKKVVAAQFKQEKFQRYASYGGLCLVAIFAIFMVNRFLVTNKQKKLIITQKRLVDEKQKEIIDSINYAKRIQTTLLAHTDFVNENIPNNFILFKPKDIVSGDFYWATKKDHLFYIAVCDSTGHGVPGAFMSLLNIGFLTEAINEKNILKPNEILDFVRNKLISTISKEGQQDGFDGILLCVDQKNRKLTYSAAHNAPLIISNKEIIQLDSDKMPVGKGVSEAPFRSFEINLKPNDVLYLYTDGYADQFGGPKGKKFLYKKMNQLIASISEQPLNEQKEILNNTFEEWRGDLEQVDDVLVIGIKI